MFSKCSLTVVNFRGQQTKGLVYDTLLEFFDEIDPQVINHSLMK